MNKKEENNSLNNSIPLATTAGATAAAGLYDEFKQWLEDKGYGSNLFTQFVTDHPYLTTTSLISVAAIGAWLASKGVM